MARDSMQLFVEEALERLPELSVRRMFGGAGIYSGQTMFGILHDRRVYLKTNETTRQAFTERGSEPFKPRSGGMLKSYYEVPAAVLDDPDQLLAWARRAIDAARTAPARSRTQSRVAPEQILDGYSDAVRELANRARTLVRGAAPQAQEAGYPGWGLIGYRCPHYFCFVAPRSDHVRVGFEHGHRLEDPGELLESMGKQVRFVRLTPGEPVPERALRRLVRAALETPPAPRAAATSSARSRGSRASSPLRSSARRP